MQQAIFGGSDTAVALRTGYRILDETVQFERPEEYQERIAVACHKFIDCETSFTDMELGMLLRSLQQNGVDDRARFFDDVRACRRRPEGKDDDDL